MLRLSLFSLFLVPALAAQAPFKSGSSWNLAENQSVLHDGDRREWNLNKLPNPNSTDHLVFETVYSLLQHWPNTRMRNGERRVRLFRVMKQAFSSRPQHGTGNHSQRYSSLSWCE